MRKGLLSVTVLAALLSISTGVMAQDKNGTAAPAGPAPNITATTPPLELARIAVQAQGGEKFQKLTSMVLIGSVELFAPNSTQSLPGKFVMVTAGDKMRIDIDARPTINFKTIYNGNQAYSSMPNFTLPPMSKLGLVMLSKYDQPGFTVSALPDKKKQRAFRIADSDGNSTDFFIDAITGRVMTFLIPFNGFTFGTEIKKTKDYDGVVVLTSFTQRLETPQGAFFADYTVKDVKLNQPVGDDVFAIP